MLLTTMKTSTISKDTPGLLHVKHVVTLHNTRGLSQHSGAT